MNSKTRNTKRSGSGNAPRETKGPVFDPDLPLASKIPNVWAQPPVNVQPSKFVSPWSVHRATPKDGQPSDLFGLHFVGRDLREWNGCVSSKIVSFDPTTMRGTTSSGRIYQLESQPGHCADGDYVLDHWADFNNVDVQDVTEEFMKTHRLTHEDISNRERSRRR